MPAKHKFNAGDIAGQFRVIGPADSKNGFARWNVECTACGKAVTLRGVALAAGARCVCSPNDPVWSQVSGTGADMEARVTALAAEVASLKARVEALSQPSKPAQTGGIKNFGPLVQHVPLTKADIFKQANATTLEEKRDALQASWARAWELARVKGRSPAEERELQDRRAIERDSLAVDLDPASQAARSADHALMTRTLRDAARVDG